MGIPAIRFRCDVKQFFLNIQYRFARCQPCSIRDSENMGVNRNGCLTEGRIEYDIGRFYTDARKRFQFLSGGGTFPPYLSSRIRQVRRIFVALVL